MTGYYGRPDLTEQPCATAGSIQAMSVISTRRDFSTWWVFGVPHDKWGETPVAAVVLRSGATASAAELRDWINERVSARYQRVSEVLLMPEFPRSAAGKTLKRELRDPYWAARGRKI